MQTTFPAFHFWKSRLLVSYTILIWFITFTPSVGLSSETDSRLARAYFEVNTNVLQIHKKILQLKIAEAGRDLHARRLAEPQNKMYDFLESYTWFFTLFIQEEQAQYKKALVRKKKLLENIRQGNSDSPYYLFCQAEILLQWATIHLKFNDKTRAAYDVYEAYNLLTENKKKFPAFKENNKSLSIIHALAQGLPSWVQKLSGISGSIAQGHAEIEVLIKNLHDYPLFEEEIIAIYTYILFYIKEEKDKAYGLIHEYKLIRNDQPLLLFLSATITQKSGRNDEAIQILESRKKLQGQIPFYYLDFLLGKYKLYRLDKDADAFILRFVQNFKGRHYIKEAYQKLYWHSLLFRTSPLKTNQYLGHIQTKGKSLIDEDAQALSESKSGAPNPVLLQARLLYDGGYYQRSQKLLLATSSQSFDQQEREEYHYRLARNADAVYQSAVAIVQYEHTITHTTGKKYFACSAALHLGLLYERDKQYAAAKKYLQLCLNLPPEGYGNSLHQKAKTALARLPE